MNKKKLRRLTTAVTAVLASVCFNAAAADGNEILKSSCSSCHNLTGPAPTTLKELWSRKAPDLFYAGNKYRAEWLEAWLQKPTRIRPAGMFYADNLKSGEKAEVVDTAKLSDHQALDKEKATAVTAELIKLKPHDDLIAKEAIEPGTIGLTMGEMVFDKFTGCLACHEIEPEYGGVTGPELYTAGARLQPAFIASFTRSPQAWDPKTWMPNKHVSDINIQKIVRYIDALSKEANNAN